MSANKEVVNSSDPELEDLLDSALEDMTKKEAPPASGDEAAPNLWSEEFIKEAAAQFENNMSAILSSVSGVPEDQITQDQIAQTFSKMAEAAALVLKPGEQAPPDAPPAAQENIDEVSAAISETLRNLNSGSETLQTPFSDADLANMFQNLNFGGEGGQAGGGNMFVPFMQDIMHSLLSKEVLYPSLRDLLDKYPAWLRDNQDKIDPNEYQRFVKQQDLMQQVCDELEPESDTDPDDVKRRRFDKVLDLMQKMQDLGQPPTELVGELASPVPPMGFAPGALGGVPGALGGTDPANCCVM